jgi:hypothetical protein
MPTATPPALQTLFNAVGSAPQLERARGAALRGTRATHVLPRPVLPVREELPHLLNRRGLLGCAVEVGVKQGEFSEMLLRHWRGRHLISVDPWQAAPAADYDDVANVQQSEHDAFYAETLQRLAQFGERSTVWRMTGAAAAERIPHHCLDFVYLDARHDEASVREDLGHWFPKVRPGGIIAGHDYLDGQIPAGDFGVKSAVDRFFAAQQLRVQATWADPPWRSWWVALPA